MKCSPIGIRSRFLAVLLLVSVSGAQTQQTPNTLKLDDVAKMPPAKLTDLAWMVGHWSGEGLGGKCEEIWSPPLGDNMIGMFRFMKDEKTAFTEFFTVVALNNSLTLKLKHFNPDFSGWEEKDKFVEFRLVKLSATEANFDGLTFRKTSEDTLSVFVTMKQKDGTLHEEEFKYRRVK